MAYKNSVDLAENDTTAFVVKLNRRHNSVVSLQIDPASNAGAICRLDSSDDDGKNWTTGISLSDPTAAVGDPFLSSVTNNGKAYNTQDRVFGASDVRVVRTDAGGGVCKVILNCRLN